MNIDQQTYQRSTNAALMGLAIQLFLAVTIGLASLLAESSALALLTYHLFGGVPIWIILWWLHTQHKAERIEALEAEQLAAADEAAAALFEEAGDQLALSRSRLSNLYKYGLNSVSMLLAIYLIAMGVTHLLGIYNAIEFAQNDAQTTSYAALIEGAINAADGAEFAGFGAIGLGLFTFGAFLVARYVAGMTKQEHWSTLRGGAAYLMGNVFTLALTAIACLAWSMNSKLILALVLPVIIAALMLTLGVEILFSFIFGIYRPRKKGEVPRAAFDSRLMGWLVRPESLGAMIGETLNYQFGFEVSRSAFLQLFRKAVWPLVVLSTVILFALSSIVIVGPHQNAVVTVNGKLSHIAEPGLSFKVPWPLGQARYYPVYQVQTLAVGSQDELIEGKAILWTTDHAADGGSEDYLLTASLRNELDDNDQNISGDLAGGRLVVSYRIGDPDDPELTEKHLNQYVNSAVEPEAVLATLSERAFARYFASKDIDHLLRYGSQEVASEEDGLRQIIQTDCDQHELGLQIIAVSLSSVHPPQSAEVAASFEAQIEARIQAETIIEQARALQIRLLSTSAGSVEHAMNINQELQTLDDLRQTLSQSTDVQEQAALNEQIRQLEVEIARLCEQAGGQAAEQLLQARARRWELELEKRATLEHLQASLASYQASPSVYATLAYFDALSEPFVQAQENFQQAPRLYIDATDAESRTIRMELEDQNTGSLLRAATTE